MKGRYSIINSLRESGKVLADDVTSDDCSNIEMINGIESYFKFVYTLPISENMCTQIFH